MAREYLAKLSQLVLRLDVEKAAGARIEVRHLFTGAAVYVNGVVCASWSPVGLAFRLPENEVTALIARGRARPLKYFRDGHVKKGYALFASPERSSPGRWKPYFVRAVKHGREMAATPGRPRLGAPARKSRR